jgi:hypothetical protein
VKEDLRYNQFSKDNTETSKNDSSEDIKWDEIKINYNATPDPTKLEARNKYKRILETRSEEAMPLKWFKMFNPNIFENSDQYLCFELALDELIEETLDGPGDKSIKIDSVVSLFGISLNDATYIHEKAISEILIEESKISRISSNQDLKNDFLDSESSTDLEESKQDLEKKSKSPIKTIKDLRPSLIFLKNKPKYFEIIFQSKYLDYVLITKGS